MGGAEHSRQGGEAWGRPKHHAQDLVQTLQNGGLSFLPAQPLSSLDGTVLATFICGLRPVSLHPERPARREGTWPVLLIPAFPEPKGLCVSGTHWGLSKYQWQELTERNPLHLTLKLGPRCSSPLVSHNGNSTPAPTFSPSAVTLSSSPGGGLSRVNKGPASQPLRRGAQGRGGSQGKFTVGQASQKISFSD